MPPPSGRASSGFSVRRIAWALCLLACCVVVAFQTWMYYQHRNWWVGFSDARTRYIHWTTVARREAIARVGDVEGLTREQVQERMTAAFGPDRPFPVLPPPPAPPGVAYAFYGELPPAPPREFPVWWRVRENNWSIAVTIYDGRADGLFVDMMRETIPRPRAPRGAIMAWMHLILACGIVVVASIPVAIVLWAIRRDHRAVAHACLMAAVLCTVVILAEDWRFRSGLDWQPLVFRVADIRSALWEAPALGFVFGLIALRVPRRRPVSGVCATCGYDLTGNLSGVCPECGTSRPAESLAT